MSAMIFNNDRMQYVKKDNMYYLFEFIKIKDLSPLLPAMGSAVRFFEELKKQLTSYEQDKLTFIRSIKEDMFKLLILQQENTDRYLLWMKCQKNGHTKTMCHTYDFNGLQQVFQNINNKDGHKFVGSKKLGDAKVSDGSEVSNEDPFTNSILETLHGLSSFHDDNGITLTKRLLDQYKTTGFDFDLYQYIPSTGEFVFYEFLKRDQKQRVNNITAHPTRYTWMTDKAKEQNKKKGGYVSDNKQKFLSLWHAKTYFKGRLYLVSYSDDVNEDISVMEILTLDEEKGIQEEKKYCMSHLQFVQWLQQMNQYTSTDKDYLRGYDMIHYKQEFFENFRNRGTAYYEYGKPFLNKQLKRSV